MFILPRRSTTKRIGHLISVESTLLYRQMTAKTIPKPANRASRYGEKDVWGIFTPLAVANNSVNLGQGFPNIPAPSFVKVCKQLYFLCHFNQKHLF